MGACRIVVEVQYGQVFLSALRLQEVIQKEIKALLKRGAALVNAGTWCSTLRKQDMTGFRFMRYNDKIG